MALSLPNLISEYAEGLRSRQELLSALEREPDTREVLSALDRLPNEDLAWVEEWAHGIASSFKVHEVPSGKRLYAEDLTKVKGRAGDIIKHLNSKRAFPLREVE